jgi:hypothetical protein
MPADVKNESRLQIGHVLFIDMVGYSRLLMHEQTAQLEILKKIVRGTEQFRSAEAEGNSCACPQVTVAPWFSATTPRRRFFARWKSAGN